MDTEFQELDDCIRDLRVTGFDGAPHVLTRFLTVTENPPLRLLLGSLLPDFDVKGWWLEAKSGWNGRSGSKSLIWPPDRAARVACQLGVCRMLATRELTFVDFTYPFAPGHGNQSSTIYWFIQAVTDPLVRDIHRLSEFRTTPPVIQDLLKMLPSSGDTTFDELLREARDKFQDKNPATRKEGLDKLWDAWERLKTLETGDKKASISRLLDDAAPSPAFRDLLERESRELTDIGNNFQIRHWERGTAPVEDTYQMDYLFHRLFALMWLILSARVASSAGVA